MTDNLKENTKSEVVTAMFDRAAAMFRGERVPHATDEVGEVTVATREPREGNANQEHGPDAG